MKQKIFTLLTALVLSIGVSWGYDYEYTWSQLNANGTYRQFSKVNGYPMYRYQWSSTLKIYFCFSDVSNSYTVSGTSYVVPEKGEYNIQSKCGYRTIANWNTNINSSYYNSLLVDGDQWFMYSGTVVVEEGADGPFIHSKGDNTITFTDYDGYYDAWASVAVGSPATYRTVSVVSNNTTMGTVSYTYKNGYVYANNRSQEFKEGSVYTLTATPKAGYRFVSWSDGKAQTHDVTINGNATYTATFALDVTEATISTSADVGGTVGGDAGKYNTNTQHTITAIANPGYGFAYWEDANHNIVSNNASYTFTLMADVNYTAIFYADGTITANSNNTDWGTVTGGGSYAGNTQVTLTATPKSGYGFIRWSDNNTENPRTITVNGDFEVTAIFEQMIVINLEEGMIEGNKSTWCTVSGGNSEYDFSFNFDENFYSGMKNYTTMDRNTEYSWVRKAGGAKRQIQAGYVVSIDFNTTFRRAVLNAQFTDEDGQKYQVRIVTNKIGSTNWYDDVERYNGYPSNMGDGNMTFSYGETDVTVGSNYLILSIYKYVSDDYGSTYQAGLFFNHSGEIKSGVYPIQGTANPGTMTVGGKDGNGFAGTWAHYTCGVMFQTGTANWLLRSGTVTLKWKDKSHYYAVVDAYAANGQHITFKVGREADVPTATHTVTFKNYDGTVLQEGQVAEGETPSYSGTPTRASTVDKVYTFTGWTPAITAVGSEDQVYTATFSESTREYTITFDWANGSKTVQQQVAYGTVPTYFGETPTKAADAQYTYAFDKWTPELVAVSGDATYTATYTTTTKEYAITFENYDGTELQKTDVAYGATPEYTGETPTRANEGLTKYTFNGWTPAIVAVTGEATYTATFSSEEVGYTLTLTSNNDAWGTAAITSEQKAKYAEGEQVTIEATQNAHCHFVQWNDGETANPRTITMDADKEFTAEFAGNFHLIDTEIAGATWYSNTYGPMVGTKTSVTIDRTFSAGWSIFSLPFDYSYVSKKNNTFRGMVYSLDEATYYNDGYLEFQFMPVSKIVANRPYILYTKTAIENPDFDNVTLKTIADGSYNERLSGEVSGTIDFINTQSKVTLAENAPDKSIIYISNNTLYYPSPRSGQKVTMRAFRGYFHLNCDIKHAPIRFYIEDEDVTMEMQADGGDDTNTTIETKKYFDREGNLIIERNGVKFDAQGKQL